MQRIVLRFTRRSRWTGFAPSALRGVPHSGGLQQALELGVFQLDHLPAFQLGRHGNHAVSDTDETAYHQPERFEQPPHFAVASLR